MGIHPSFVGWTTVIFAITVHLSFHGSGVESSTCSTSTDRTETDCSTYHVCYRGVSVNVLKCPEGLRWSKTEGRCSLYSRCRQRGERPPTTSIFTTPRATKPTTRRTTTTTTTQKTVSTTLEPTSTVTTETPTEPTTQKTTTTTTSDSVTETLPLLSDCGIITTPYIVGGTPAFEGEWPWQILLKGRINGTHETQCGGVLVEKRWVMTAAHCVFRTALHSIDAWTIVLGEHATTYSSGREKVVRPSRIIRHTGYQPRGGFPDDIALMELPEGVYIEKRFIMPVCLPPRDFVIPEGSPCWITGWGNTDAQGHGSEVLNSLSVTVWSQKQCQMAWGEHITTQHICVGTGDTGACAGDSGGPLSCEVNGRFVVAGIASWGVPGCRTPGYPDVYTNVTAYMSWIRNHVIAEEGGLWNPG
ncbi:elastase-1-like [Liolophura sinensis]|uniref:elastase-1-like n=1 Tax=Liolophura sinensis TaxID=3198878 RepID=UPI0031599348